MSTPPKGTLPTRPPLPPPGVDQSAWPAPPKCPGSALCDASGADMRRQAPKVFDVVFHTTTGDVRVRAWRDLAPAGADRLYNLARLGYYDSSPLYRITGLRLLLFRTSVCCVLAFSNLLCYCCCCYCFMVEVCGND